MNTLEVKTKNRIKSFDDLYKYAEKQFLDYEKLEGIDNWKKYDFSIDCSEDQMKFKDMIQIRFIEELTEASAAEEYEHFWEEITDALNFFLSSYIMLDIDFNNLDNPENILINKIDNRKKLWFNNYYNFKNLSLWFYPLVHQTGKLCNLLKNRPWAQSNYLVSLYDFNIELKELWSLFWNTLNTLGLTKEIIFELFERKYLVNNIRRKSGY